MGRELVKCPFLFILDLTVLNFESSRLEICNFNISSYGKSFRGLRISRIFEKISGGGVAENYGTVGKFHKNINFSLKIVSYRISRKVISK